MLCLHVFVWGWLMLMLRLRIVHIVMCCNDLCFGTPYVALLWHVDDHLERWTSTLHDRDQRVILYYSPTTLHDEGVCGGDEIGTPGGVRVRKDHWVQYARWGPSERGPLGTNVTCQWVATLGSHASSLHSMVGVDVVVCVHVWLCLWLCICEMCMYELRMSAMWLWLVACRACVSVDLCDSVYLEVFYAYTCLVCCCGYVVIMRYG